MDIPSFLVLLLLIWSNFVCDVYVSATASSELVLPSSYISWSFGCVMFPSLYFSSTVLITQTVVLLSLFSFFLRLRYVCVLLFSNRCIHICDTYLWIFQYQDLRTIVRQKIPKKGQSPRGSCDHLKWIYEGKNRYFSIFRRQWYVSITYIYHNIHFKNCHKFWWKVDVCWFCTAQQSPYWQCLGKLQYLFSYTSPYMFGKFKKTFLLCSR